MSISILEAQDQTLNKITFKGNKNIKSSDIQKQLNMKPYSGFRKLFFWQKRPDYDPELLAQDKINIIRYLQANGYLYSELDTVVKEKRNGKVNIEYNIKENRPVRIEMVRFTVNDTLTIENPVPRRRRVLFFNQPTFNSRRGTIFRDSAINEDKAFVNNAIIRNGFLKSETNYVVTLEEDPDKRDSKVSLDFYIYPGKRYYVNRKIILGNRNTDRKTVNDQITLQDSTVYRASVIDESNENLMKIGVFRSVHIYPTFIDDTEYVNAVFNFSEQLKWTAKTGFGYGTEERFRFSADFTHHNIFKKADQQQLSFKTSYLEPWNIQFRWTQPGFLHRKLTLVVNPFYLREDEKDYTLDTFGNTTTLSYYLIKNWTLYLSHQLEQNDIFDISAEIDEKQQVYNLSTVSSKLDLNYSFPKYNPVEGFHVITNAGLAGVGMNNNYNYYFLGQEFRYYQPIKNSFLLAYRGAYQTQDEINESSEIPLPNMYKLGGMQSVRGYYRDTIGPREGGRSSLLINVEARIPLYKDFNTALLYDAGHVLSKSYAYNFKELSQSVGIGFRYVTKFGTIRTDFATPLHHITFKEIKWYLTIGETF